MTERQAAHDAFAPPLPAVGRQPVVVGYDGTSEGDNALEWAAALAVACRAPLQVLYAVEPPARGSAAPGGEAEPQEWPGRAAGVARRGADRARERYPDLRVQPDGAVGNPAAELVVRSATASLVVVGRRTSPRADALGSVSFAVGAYARCPVVVVPGASPPVLGAGFPVVVGVDGSASSSLAVTFATDMARLAGAELVLVSAWQRPSREPWMAGSDEVPEQSPGSAKPPGHRAAVQVVRNAAALVHEMAPNLPVIQVIRQGSAHEVLIDAAKEAGLLIVGSRGAGGFVGLQVGSVSRAVLRRATIPVAVVHQGSQR